MLTRASPRPAGADRGHRGAESEFRRDKQFADPNAAPDGGGIYARWCAPDGGRHPPVPHVSLARAGIKTPRDMLTAL